MRGLTVDVSPRRPGVAVTHIGHANRSIADFPAQCGSRGEDGCTTHLVQRRTRSASEVTPGARCGGKHLACLTVVQHDRVIRSMPQHDTEKRLDVTTAVAPLAPLNAADRCDRCGAQAYLRVELVSGGELLFCAHHAREHGDRLREVAASIHDETDRLGGTPAASAGSGR